MKFRSLDKKRIENDKLRMTEPFILFTDNQNKQVNIETAHLRCFFLPYAILSECSSNLIG